MKTPPTITVCKLSSANEFHSLRTELTNILSRAFFHDPYYVYIMPNEKKRLSQIRWWMRILLKYAAKNGDIYVTSDLKGVSMWFGPAKPLLDNVQLAFLGLLLYPLKVGFTGFLRMLDVSARWEKVHQRQNPRNYYLMVIGVDPDYQRKGYGNLLMKDVLAQADRDGTICYLETVTPENVMFYQKHHFQTIANQSFGSAYQYWIMVRNPQNKK